MGAESLFQLQDPIRRKRRGEGYVVNVFPEVVLSQWFQWPAAPPRARYRAIGAAGEFSIVFVPPDELSEYRKVFVQVDSRSVMVEREVRCVVVVEDARTVFFKGEQSS